MPKNILRAVALAAALLPALGAVAAPLTLDLALDLAVQRSQMARAARAGAMSAAEIMHTANSALLPFRKLHISLKLLCFSVFFSDSIKVLKKNIIQYSIP